MNSFRDGQRLDATSAAARRRYVTKAKAWTRHHSERLGVTETAILAAICRGWLPEDIEALSASRVGCLSRSPIVATLAAAPIQNVVRGSEPMERRRERQIAGTLKERAAA